MAVMALSGGLNLGVARVVAAQPSGASTERIQALLVRDGFAGEVVVADRERVRVAAVTGGTAPGRTWRWASVSKQVAAALAMRQVQAGRLSLDDPIAKHLPAATAHPDVTVRQLLMHTSGLPNPEVAALAGDPLPVCLGPAAQPPALRFEYRNCDTIVLAALLADLTGRPYAELLREELTLALGAHSIEPAMAPPAVTAYGAAGSLTGTALELLAFDRALLEQRWLSPELTRVMWTGEPRWGYVAPGARVFQAKVPGCAAPVTLVERRGAVDGAQVRNIIAPDLGMVVIVFTPSESFEFGEVWQGRGFTHDLLGAVLCAS